MTCKEKIDYYAASKRMTKNIIGTMKMARRGQKHPYWMVWPGTLDNLAWAKIHRKRG